MAIFWRFFAFCISASHVQHISDMHSKFMCGSMVDIQSATAEISRGKRKKEEEQDENIMSTSATQGGHNNKWLK